jgi:hypothetical protein
MSKQNASTISPSSLKKIIKLNVGGQEFTTTRATLHECSPNYFTEHMLENGAHAPSNYFIDRDPTSFEYILNYLRGHSLSLLPESPLHSPHIQRKLLEEAEFYQLTDLQESIEAHLKRFHPLPKPNPEASPSSTSPNTIPNLKLWHQLENVRTAYEKAKETKPESRQTYPQGFKPNLNFNQDPPPTANQIKKQIELLKGQLQEWKIEDKIEETKQFLLTSIQYLQILSPQNPLANSLKDQVEQFYQTHKPLFHQLATQTTQSAQAPFELLNQLLNFIWSQNLSQTPEGQSATSSPADVMFQLLSKLGEMSNPSSPDEN